MTDIYEEESAFHRRHRHHQRRRHRPACCRGRVGPHPDQPRLPGQGSPHERADHPGRRPRRIRARSGPGRHAVGLRLRFHRVRARARRARLAPLPRPDETIYVHQFRVRLPETSDQSRHHREHAARQPVLAVLARQDRLRGLPDGEIPHRRLPRHDHPPQPHLRRPQGAPGRARGARHLAGAPPDAGRQARHHPGRRHDAVDPHAQLRLRQGFRGLDGQSACPGQCLPHHLRRDADLEPDLRDHRGCARRRTEAVLRVLGVPGRCRAL